VSALNYATAMMHSSAGKRIIAPAIVHSSVRERIIATESMKQ